MLRYIKALRHPRTAFGKLKTKFRMNFYNIGYRMIGSLDGYPLPPAHLVDLVIGTKEIAWYQLGGLFMI